jgi:hypothetical protein
MVVVGDKHPRTGRKRVYDESAITDALILTVLTDAGVAAVRVGQFKDTKGVTVLQLGRMVAEKISQTDRAREPDYLIIASRDPAPPLVFLSQPSGQHALPAVDAEWSIVLNLTKILERSKNRED